jgi:hypothetical protein
VCLKETLTPVSKKNVQYSCQRKTNWHGVLKRELLLWGIERIIAKAAYNQSVPYCVSQMKRKKLLDLNKPDFGLLELSLTKMKYERERERVINNHDYPCLIDC